MTNEEAFEKWAIDYGLDYEPSFTRDDVEAAWQAAITYMQEQNEPVGVVSWFEGTVIGSIFPSSNMPKDDDLLYTTPPDTAREIAEFKSQINELKSLLIDARDDVAAKLDAYQELLPYKQHRYDAQKNTLDAIDKALSKTPAQSLQEHDNEVIERCAKSCELWDGLKYNGAGEIIRALKGKQNGT